MIKPNYNNYGLSYPMGEKLRREVEMLLSQDIRHYGIYNEILNMTVLKVLLRGDIIKSKTVI